MSAKAIVVSARGGPEVLQLSDRPERAPARGEALVRLEAIGVNFIDVYYRVGLYETPLPYVPGQEGAGVVAAIGEGVCEVRVGDRVAYTGVMGAYARTALVPAARLVKIPDGLGARQAAAAMLQGMTAHYLTHATCPLEPGDWCVVHAAAGGVGLLLCQLAKRRGARVLGTVSTEQKAALAREAGADEVVLYTQEDFVARVKRATGGRGARVVYDSVGRSTFEQSLEALSPRGLLALFGQSSGPVPPFDPAILNKKGSLFLTRPSLHHYTASREELLARASDVLSWTLDGSLKLRIERELPLAEAAEAHRLLEGRRTAGKLLLIP